MSHEMKTRILRRHVRSLLRPFALLGPGMAVPGLALAGPTGEVVVGGDADILRPNANGTVVNQLTHRAAIDWQTFNVDADEYVLFNQPGASSIVLNRVLGGDASHILGQMQANGQVFLLNPQGVFFTHGASLDVQGFLASTLDMNPDDFMAGDFTLARSGASPTNAQVVNAGNISAGPGGYVVLAGDYTENTGIVTANAGTVALVSGNALTLDIEGDGLVSFTVDEATLSAAAGVRNAGSLIADGGRVIMTAKVASDLVATAVNNEGLVRAHSIEERDGEIYLMGYGGDVVNAGTLDADGDNADGGFIGIYGDEDVTLADGAIQTAAADANHTGGVIRAIAEDHLDYQNDNLIRVTGGKSGGFVEVSGHGSIALRGTPQIGAGGTYLIDPSVITIFDGANTTPTGSVGSINDGYIEGQLNLGVNVILAASSSVVANPGVSITASTASADLTIGIGALSGSAGTTCAGLNSSFCFGPGVIFNQFGNGTVDLTGVDIDIRGDLKIQAGSLDGNLIVGNVTADGNILLDAGKNSVGSGGDLTVGQINAPGNVTLISESFSIGGIGQVVQPNSVTIQGEGNSANVSITGGIHAGGSISITTRAHSDGGANITVSGDIITFGDITLSADAGSVSNGGVINVQRLSGNNIIIDAIGGSTGTGGSFMVSGSNDIVATGNIDIEVTGGATNGGNIDVVGGNVQGAGTVTLTATGGTLAMGDGVIDVDGIVSGASITLTAQAGSSATGGNIMIGGISGGVSGGNLTANATAGSSIGGNINIFGDVNMTGVVNMTATGASSEGNINVTGNLAGADITVTANGGSFNGGSVDIGGTVTASGGNIEITAAIGGSASGGNISIGGNVTANSGSVSMDFIGTGSNSSVGIQAGDIAATVVQLDAVNSGGSANATINVGNVIATAADIDIKASGGGTGDGSIVVGTLTANGNIDVQAHGGTLGGRAFVTTQTVNADGNVNIYAGAPTEDKITVNGNIVAGGDIWVWNQTNGDIAISGDINGDGNVTLQAFGASSGVGNIAAGNINAVGRVEIEAVNGDQHSFGDITARHINAHFTPYASGSVNVTMGNLHVNGTAVNDRDIVVQLHDVSGILNGNLNIASATAENGGVDLNALSSAGTGAANITVGNVQARDFIRIAAINNVITQDLAVINTTGLAEIVVQAGRYADSVGTVGNIQINGDISASGRATAANPLGADVTLHAGSGGSNDIVVTGTISVDAAAATYNLTSIPLSGADSGSFDESGNQGIAQVNIFTGEGSADIGGIAMNAVGTGLIGVHARNISVGDIEMNVADGDFVRTSTLTQCSSTGCAIARTETMNDGGQADLLLHYDGGATSGSAQFGNVAINAGSGHMNVGGFLNVQGGGIAINATGNDFEVASTGTFEGAAINYTQSNLGGGADVNIHTVADGGTVILTGAVNLSAPGNAGLHVTADTIKLRGIAATATAGTFVRDGTPAGNAHTGPFDRGGGGGPHISEGTLVGGGAQITLNGFNPSPSFEADADTVIVDGAIALAGAGAAQLEISGTNVTVTGDITATATRMQQNGIVDSTFTDSGDTIHETGTVVSDWGTADVDIGGNGNMQLADIAISGPGASGRVEGANVRVGAVSVTASGGTLDVDIDESVNGGPAQALDITAPNTLTGFALRADNTLELTGDLTLNAVGVGGVLLLGDTIKTQGISINVTDGEYNVQAADGFVAVDENFTAGNAVLGFFGGAAQVNGDVTLTASREVHFGGAADVSGDFTVTAGTNVRRAIPDNVQFLNALDSEDDDAGIELPAAFDVQASNISLTATAGNLSISGVNLDATTVQMTAGGNIVNGGAAGSIDAGALAISAGGDVVLSETALVTGTGRIADVTGDAAFLTLLAAEGVAVPDGGPNLSIRGQNVALGDVGIAGDYMFIEANNLTLDGTIASTDPELLLQVAPFGLGASFSLAQSSAGGGDAAYVHDGTLDAFNPATIALGTTAHTGNATIEGAVNVGDTNLFVLTNGTVTGLDNVLSTGIVKDLQTLIRGEFEVPQTDEIDTSQDIVQSLHDRYGLDDRGEDDDDGDEEGEDTDTDTDVEGDEDSLISRDTAEEEMMCR